MKKKVIGIVLIAVFAVSSLFAANNIVTVTASPYGMQFVNTSLNINFRSNYGFGVKAGYRYHLNAFLLGADISYQNYMYNFNGNKASLNNIQVLAKVGGKISISEKFDLNGDVGAGIDVGLSRVADNYTNFTIGASGSASYYISSNMAVVAGVDLSLEWAKSKNSEFKSTQLNIISMLGAEIDF